MRGATFPRGAMPGSNAAMGYLQYVEGIANDAFPNGDGNPALTPFYATGNVLDSNLPARYVAPNGTLMTASLDSAAYFQNINGSINTSVDPNYSRFGDMDDVLSLTTRNVDTPFEGQIVFRQNADLSVAPTFTPPQKITSPMAEVVWWVEGFDENLDGVIADGERRLHRRVFLIRPDLSNAVNILWRSLINDGTVNVNGTDIQGMDMNPLIALQVMMEQCDISFHIDPNGNAVANSLADLSAHANFPSAPIGAWCKRITKGQLFRLAPPNPATFSGAVPIPPAINSHGVTIPGFRLLEQFVFPKTSPVPAIGRNRIGEDVMISSVAGFDARIFDPMAAIKMHTTGVQVQPGDPGYEWKQPGDGGYVAQAKVGEGAFVDLGYANARIPANMGTNTSWFSGPPSEFSGFFRVGGGVCSHFMLAYDTWSPLVNDTEDGVDDTAYGSSGIIDDLLEVEREFATQVVSPPYPAPLRALQITLRTYDPDSKQIRQMKASASYTND
jgi:hypothetical protein